MPCLKCNSFSMEESAVQELDEYAVSIPRGGPIYVSNLVGPCTRIPDFENSIVNELQNLQATLCQGSSEVCDDDILVDELKVFTEEELVDMALKEAFKDRENNKNHPPLVEESNAREDDCRVSINDHTSSDMSRGADASALFEQWTESSSGAGCNRNMSGKNSKRRRRGPNNSISESGCIEKVEQIVKIKQKQEEDKAAVRLHSFNPACKTGESALKSAKTERMRSLRSTNSAKKVNTIDLQEHIPVQYPEVLLYVEVYHNARKCVKTQELVVLGGQTLTALRDKIYCSMDQVMHKAGQYDPSGYFLIEDVFFSDLRDPSAIDYTKPILDWLQNSKDEVHKKWECIITGELQQKQKAIMGEVSPPSLPHFTSVDMHKIRFCDLRFRLGTGYVYCHQGECVHTLVIRDMRLIHPDDVHNQAVYPIVTFQLKFRFQKCSVCKIFRATKVTVDDKWAQENPCHFCDECFSLLHDAEDGSQLYTDYLEYDYHHE